LPPIAGSSKKKRRTAMKRDPKKELNPDIQLKRRLKKKAARDFGIPVDDLSWREGVLCRREGGEWVAVSNVPSFQTRRPRQQEKLQEPPSRRPVRRW
jgi:hypothetical protein